MSERYDEHERVTLDETMRRLEAVLNNASVSIFLMDDQQQCIYMNPAAEQLTGFTLKEVLVLNRPLHDIVHHRYPDGRPFPLSECAIDRAFPEHNQTQGEEVFVHRSGTFYPVAFTASPIRDEASKTVGTIIEVRDITAEKAAQERQQVLINELNHRVKNTLSTVQSLAWHSFKGSDPEARQQFDERLTALSRAHNILTEEAWLQASLAEVIRQSLAPFATHRIEIAGEDCQIDSKAAVSLSMVLHELATNAVKHGAWSVAEGRVALWWEAQSEKGLIHLKLEWQEHDGPPVAPPARHGFGTRLIERQVAKEFSGTTRIDFIPSGVVCTLALQLPNPTTLTI